MKFKIEVGQKRIEEYFETIDWLKEMILKSNNDNEDWMSDYYQAKLDEYEMNLENIVIERG